jgi:hypothetical protein
MLNYEEWLNLSEDEKMSLTDAEMPQIPADQLTNHLTAAKAEKRDGVMGWTITQEIRNGTRTLWFPEFRQKKVNGIPMWYRFNPMNGTYSLQIEAEPSMEEEPIGSYGMQWMHFMETQHPELVELMELRNQYLTVARSVDKAAWEYRELLDSQYEQMNPRPTGSFEKIEQWERTRTFYTDSTVMRERVLVPVTTP